MEYVMSEHIVAESGGYLSFSCYALAKQNRHFCRNLFLAQDFLANVSFFSASLTPRLRIHGVKSKIAEAEARLANESFAHFLKRCFTLMDRGELSLIMVNRIVLITT